MDKTYSLHTQEAIRTLEDGYEALHDRIRHKCDLTHPPMSERQAEIATEYEWNRCRATVLYAQLVNIKVGETLDPTPGMSHRHWHDSRNDVEEALVISSLGPQRSRRLYWRFVENREPITVRYDAEARLLKYFIRINIRGLGYFPSLDEKEGK